MKRLKTDLRNELAEKEMMHCCRAISGWRCQTYLSNQSWNYYQVPRHVLATHNTGTRYFLLEPEKLSLTSRAFTAAALRRRLEIPSGFVLFFEHAMSKISHMAHWIPFADSCCKIWIPAVRYLVGLKDWYYQASYNEILSIFKAKAVAGVCKSASTRILHENWNFIYLYN